MDAHSEAWMAGLVGGGLGLAGGLVGTVVGVCHTHGPRERSFAVRAAAAMWAALLAFLLGLWLLPVPYNALLWLPQGLLLPLAIRAGNRRLEAIRREEAGVR